ncbi:hypothetical protein L3X38_026175 [Prunus dulcis]|uniref:Uncharacterized protein n=1 Tax=Prunus dulcis TaxID=3755 RepID=A0AAD4W3U5_PRUDU|nr:hypothetical protein L3X38_026175 [Prunus dulcis]
MQPHQTRPRAATRAGSAWVCRVISGDGKNSTPEVILPTLASTRGQEHFLQLRGGPIPAATGRNFSLKFGPNPRFSNPFPTLTIDPNLYQHQLELVKRRRNHTSITGFGRRRRRRDGGTVPARTSRAHGRRSWFPTGKTGRSWSGRRGESNGTGLGSCRGRSCANRGEREKTSGRERD